MIYPNTRKERLKAKSHKTNKNELKKNLPDPKELVRELASAQ